MLTCGDLSTASLGGPGLLPPGGRDEHGQVDQHREPRGHRLQDHRGPRLGERDDGALLTNKQRGEVVRTFSFHQRFYSRHLKFE